MDTYSNIIACGNRKYSDSDHRTKKKKTLTYFQRFKVIKIWIYLNKNPDTDG